MDKLNHSILSLIKYSIGVLMEVLYDQLYTIQ